ncbi:fibrinogen-like protein 1 [Drosophila innubila]|uniref:fibrinogen-like protein 1 n=1 Tax=Drosophila innubila TaxID=198719 RepID=UPI00148B43D6|nr:fibrinogen-like protein 1 [Drosophila innubila]
MEAFSVPCDSSLAGSGWTVIQRRKDGSENFNRNWTDYRQGFGDLRGEFFIGLEKLHLITKSQNHELYIYMRDFENQVRYARYNKFFIGDEKDLYEIKSLGTYSGDAQDSMDPHKNMKFSTPDRNSNTCAKGYKSGWWFHSCYTSNLNGIYDKNATKINDPGIKWNNWHTKSLKFVQMMIKPN